MRFSQQLLQLPEFLAAHVKLTLLALAIGASISLPLGVLCAKVPRVGAPILAVASVVQTIPGLALLAMMVALTSSFGFYPALLALVAYSALPILRNTAAGLAAVDRDIIESATALGMTPRERLFRVELPLAAPLIVAGLRTSAVWIVGTATLSTPVGQTSLGNLIFGGLQTRNFDAVLVGSFSAALLAVAIDAVLGVVQRSLTRGRRVRAWPIALTAVAALSMVAALVPTRPSRARSAPLPSPRASAAPRPLETTSVRVGSKAFTEQYVLAAAVARLLEGAGLKVDRRESLGSTVAFDALRSNQIDVYVDYSGTLWSTVLSKKGTAAPWRVLAETCGQLAARYHVRCLGSLGFENAYALAMRAERAKELEIRDLDDLARQAPSLSLGTDLEFLDRAEWTALESAYDLRFRRATPYDPSFMYDAVAKREVDVITAFSSDARIAAQNLVVLGDPRRALPPYDAVILISPIYAADSRVEHALRPLLDSVNVNLMRRASLLVDQDLNKKSPDEAARWLLQNLDREVKTEQ
jgi:osmoprotectant transport system permease protein